MPITVPTMLTLAPMVKNGVASLAFAPSCLQATLVAGKVAIELEVETATTACGTAAAIVMPPMPEVVVST